MKPAQSSRPTAEESERGRDAKRPSEIPRRGWWDIFWRVKAQLEEDNLSIVAAGLALYALLAVFPALGAVVSIYGLFTSPAAIAEQMQSLTGVLPSQALEILNQQLQELAKEKASLGIGAIVGILIALWSARRGMTALITGTNIAYNERERRGTLHQIGLSLALTLGAVLGFIAIVVFGVAVPLIVNFLPLGDAAEWILLVLRWLILWAIVTLGLSIVYRFAPARTGARWRWVTWGSAIASTLWMLASLGFALYVRNFDSYTEGYGALGGVVVMLMWFYISSFVVLLGAEINSEMERQTKADTTEGAEKPLGERGAFSADTVGPAKA